MTLNQVLQVMVAVCGVFAIALGWKTFEHSRAAAVTRVVEGTFVEIPRPRGGSYPGIQVGDEKYFCRRHVCLHREKHAFSKKPAIGVLDRSDRLIELRVGSEWAVHPREIEIDLRTDRHFAIFSASLGILGLLILVILSRRAKSD